MLLSVKQRRNISLFAVQSTLSCLYWKSIWSPEINVRETKQKRMFIINMAFSVFECYISINFDNYNLQKSSNITSSNSVNKMNIFITEFKL